MKFKNLKDGQAFTPIAVKAGEKVVGASLVYVKKENGVCPRLGVKEEGIFWPEDAVDVVNLPKRNFHRNRENA